MRIGNGPRLVVPRPGLTGYRGYYGRWMTRGQAYDEYRRAVMDRLRKMPGPATWERKGRVTLACCVPYGTYFRLADGHGRAYGPRHWSPVANVPTDARVRRVNRQDEDYHSRVSRILKAAHRRMLRED